MAPFLWPLQSLNLYSILLAFVFLLVVVITLYQWQFQTASSLPPGPRPLPFVGNILEWLRIQRSMEAETFRLWKKYGDVYTLWQGTTPCIVVNTAELGNELMEKRGAHHSGRPQQNLFRQIIRQWRLLNVESGEIFRTIRRIYLYVLGPKCAALYIKHQDYESKMVLKSLLNQPEHFLDEARRYTVSVIFSATYGLRTSSLDHPLLQELHDIYALGLTYSHPGSLLVDHFPILEKLPQWAQPWLLAAKRYRARDLHIQHAFLTNLRNRIAEGNPPDCAGVFIMEVQEKEGISDDNTCDMLTQLIQGGSETMTSVHQYFFKILAMYPDAVSKAHAELDRVVGTSRLPQWSDRAQLPYIRSIVKELHRYGTIGSFSIPHACEKADVFHGYTIPEGTIIYPHLQHMNMDKKRYGDDATLFLPERFLDDELDSLESAQQGDFMKRDHWHYGHGRRLCPGILPAESGLFFFVSRILWGFDLASIPGHVLREEDKIYALLTRPKPFQMIIKPRSPNHADVMSREASDAWTDLGSLDDVKY